MKRWAEWGGPPPAEGRVDRDPSLGMEVAVSAVCSNSGAGGSALLYNNAYAYKTEVLVSCLLSSSTPPKPLQSLLSGRLERKEAKNLSLELLTAAQNGGKAALRQTRQVGGAGG